MTQTAIPDAQAKRDARDKDVPWYSETMGPRLGPSARKLLEEYSHIPADQVESHIYAIRDRAWQVWPYPCIGQFRFLDLSITLNAHYATLLQRLTTENQTFLDMGCCFGQDVRALVAGGAVADNLYATDLRRDFWELGYELFKDGETLTSHFIEGDVLADDSNAAEGEGLKALDGKIDIVYAGSFLHLFNYADQSAVCERAVRLLRPVKGSAMAGRQVGYKIAGEKPHATKKGGSMFRHNIESFEKMWAEVSEKTGTKWRVEAKLIERQREQREASAQWEPDAQSLMFTVFRE